MICPGLKAHGDSHSAYGSILHAPGDFVPTASNGLAFAFSSDLSSSVQVLSNVSAAMFCVLFGEQLRQSIPECDLAACSPEYGP